MSQRKLQTFDNHTRLHPPFHFFLLPVLAGGLVVSIVNLVCNPGWPAGGQALLSAALLLAAFMIRVYSLKVQDRVIRLEERLRLTTLLSEPLRARIGELNESQMVGLRFASDGEVAELVEKTLANGWKNAEIKKAIRAWRPDYFRV